MRIFKSNIIAILLYRGETWRMTKAHDERLDTFLHTCLKRILKVHWPIGVSNDEIRRRAGNEKISKQVRRRRWKWTCSAYGTKSKPTCGVVNLGTKREKETRNAKENMDENSGVGTP